MTDSRTGLQWILGDRFDQIYPHPGSLENLRSKKWKLLCELSHDGRSENFDPIFEELIKKGIHDGLTDEHTAEFLYRQNIGHQGRRGSIGRDKKKAFGLYLRAWAVYTIARFSHTNSTLKTEA
ncbi:hypothetical protein DOTSEDRAFT_23713 [Dothistroma septosporum NZE10]|uniref:Uncharacterized protein n=1 Tax=Dothistroma septosporum (strain NZE10 / CBS 128990) TaxID=675120 RepID=N1PTN2_DOTSN|nr:hypothetical protein DOTSEDRAFT_23713 [Dothistroma septosporum NZE10]